MRSHGVAHVVGIVHAIAPGIERATSSVHAIAPGIECAIVPGIGHWH